MLFTITARYDENGAFTHDFSIHEGYYLPPLNSMYRPFHSEDFELVKTDGVEYEVWSNKRDITFRISIERVSDEPELHIIRDLESFTFVNNYAHESR